MKTKLLLLLLLASFSIHAQQYTSIPDVNFENKLISLGIDSGAPDGRVLTSNVASIVYLYVDTSSITDLTGIEDFISLKELKCSSNRLTQLNLSKNKALTSLECSNNLLTALDISNNPLLLKLDCSQNKLTALDFSNNTALKTIYCSSNQLTALNVSKQLMLEQFFCYTNKIEILDLSSNVNLSGLACHTNLLKNLDLSKNTKVHYVQAHNNPLISFNIQNGTNYLFDASLSTLTFNSPNLKCVQVDNVEEANVRWASVKGDVQYSTYCSPYTIIPDTNFEKKLIALGIDKDGENGKVLTADITAITSLNVSNSSISDLTGIQDFHNLTNLSCNGNLLSTLDITKNVYLTDLNCNQNKITALNLSNNRALKTLYCSSNQLTKIDLSYNSSLQVLDISQNKLDKLEVNHNGALTSLKLDENLITSLDLLNNKALTTLSLEKNKLAILNLTNNTLLTNAVSFKSNPELYCVQVSDLAYANTNWFDKKDPMTSFSSTACLLLEYFTLIPDSNFENKLISLGIESGTADGKILTSKVASLTSLNVSQSSISNLTGIEAFVALKTLNCSNNRLTQLNVSKNTLLTSLECNNNQLTALNLSNNSALLTLEVSNNNIFGLDFSNNTALKSIRCYNNFISNINVSKQLALESLDFGYNRVQNIDLSFNVNLQSLLCNANSLQSLDLSKNNKLTTMVANINSLSSLNIKNGANNLFYNSGSLIRFDNNDYLACIQVDNVEEANARWSNQKNPKASFSTDCRPYTLIPDLNFENKLISLGIDSGAPDGKVLTTNIASIANLDLTDSSIKDLTGIEDFRELTGLYANKNQITTLDLSSNPKLTSLLVRENKLENVNVRENTQLTNLSIGKNKLTTLDLSQNTKLTSLNAEYNNLTTLDLSNNKLLYVTNLTYNQLTTLDLSKNTILEYLQCGNNKLTSLNIKNASILSMLECQQNLLTSLDLSDNIALRNLICSKNALTSLNTANNIQLNSIDCSENNLTSLDLLKNINLYSLYCDVNQLTALNVSKNILLVSLSVYGNSLTTLDVSKNTELNTFYCYSNLLTSVDISSNTKITRLQVDLNKLTSLNLKNGNNTILDRKYTNFNNNPDLTCILVDDVNYSNANWAHLKDAAAKYSLDCSTEFVQISDSNFEQKLIDLGIDTDGLNGKITIADATAVTTLDLSNSSIKDLTGIEYFTSLTYLDVSSNQLTALNVSKNIKLETLNASSNQLTTIDLSNNTKLRIVYAVNNPLISLNLRNGNNANFILPSNTAKSASGLYTTFLGLKTLGCIQVDNEAYSNANWSNIKESTTTYSNTCKTLSVPESAINNVVIHPNPTKGELHIQNVNLEKANVYNVLGQLVKSFTLNSNNTDNTINLSGLPKGVYYVYLINQDTASAKKVIVE